MRYCEILERDCPADCHGWHMPCLDEPDPPQPSGVWWWFVTAAVVLAVTVLTKLGEFKP